LPAWISAVSASGRVWGEFDGSGLNVNARVPSCPRAIAGRISLSPVSTISGGKVATEPGEYFLVVLELGDQVLGQSQLVSGGIGKTVRTVGPKGPGLHG